MSERKKVMNESPNEVVRYDPARQHIPGEENQGEVRRRGRRRAAGQDTPAGAQTDRTVERAKQELEEREEESS